MVYCCACEDVKKYYFLLYLKLFGIYNKHLRTFWICTHSHTHTHTHTHTHKKTTASNVCMRSTDNAWWTQTKWAFDSFPLLSAANSDPHPPQTPQPKLLTTGNNVREGWGWGWGVLLVLSCPLTSSWNFGFCWGSWLSLPAFSFHYSQAFYVLPVDFGSLSERLSECVREI